MRLHKNHLATLEVGDMVRCLALCGTSQIDMVVTRVTRTQLVLKDPRNSLHMGDRYNRETGRQRGWWVEGRVIVGIVRRAKREESHAG